MRMEAILSTDAQQLDKQSLVRVYEDYSPGLYRYAYRLLGDQDLAEECVAETFSRFLQVIRHGRSPEGNLRAYLYRMAHNSAVDSIASKPPMCSWKQTHILTQTAISKTEFTPDWRLSSSEKLSSSLP